ncbi:HD domain containing protein [Pseudohyphozyma bogoriensis]|nr:HD domain containing protein [Pseudohyphozyma bogoriensis]
MCPRGFTPLDRNPDLLKPLHDKAPVLSLEELKSTIPDTPIIRKSLAYLTPKLPKPIFNHSHRAYLYAVAIAKGLFPDWKYDPESFYLACLFHDLGATPENLAATKLSFEFYGAFLARQFLLPSPESATQDEKDVADGVAEAICRHTNFIEGKITTHGQMIQLGTLFDNAGNTSTWVAPETVKAIVTAYPRYQWTCGFHDAMKKEVELKPWSHTTFFDAEDIWDLVKGNKIAAPIEEDEKKAGVKL